jgi:hypothetical protein
LNKKSDYLEFFLFFLFPTLVVMLWIAGGCAAMRPAGLQVAPRVTRFPGNARFFSFMEVFLSGFFLYVPGF